MYRVKKSILFAFLFFPLHSFSQSVAGYWYGTANVKGNGSTNNYLVELILNQDRTLVKGVVNYYFKNTYRSLSVNGNYNSLTRQLTLFNVPVTYHGSLSDMEIDCIMDMLAKLRVSQQDARLIGYFSGKPEYKFTCVDINFTLIKNADASKNDSVLNAIRHYKESYQVWKPSATDTLVAAKVIQRKVENYVINKQFTERENVVANEITVDSDSIRVDFYDNGEVDGDSISVFFNKQLLAFNMMISEKAIHFDLGLDTSREINEISMFANNLGAIPPNTALMIIRDGKKRYDINLSSDFHQNATVRIKRKKKISKTGG